jgi:hypothetical protein
MALYVIDSTEVSPNGMEEVTGSIPVRSTNQANNLDEPSLRSPEVCDVVRRSGAWPRTTVSAREPRPSSTTVRCRRRSEGACSGGLPERALSLPDRQFGKTCGLSALCALSRWIRQWRKTVRGKRGKVPQPTRFALSRPGSSAPGCRAKSLPSLAAAFARVLDGACTHL